MKVQAQLFWRLQGEGELFPRDVETLKLDKQELANMADPSGLAVGQLRDQPRRLPKLAEEELKQVQALSSSTVALL